MRSRVPLGIRFARKIQAAPGECWTWVGAKNEHGYGVLGRGGRGDGLIKAHRIAYELFYRIALQPSQCVLHRCDNPPCVNPDHLFLGTQTDNLLDMRTKQRDSPPPHRVGVFNNKAKLNDEKVIHIFSLRNAGLSIRQIAESLGVARKTVHSVLNRKTWRHINVTDHFR